MKHAIAFAIGGLLLTATIGRATPPGQGQHFDCTDGGDTSCAADDSGCVSNSKPHLACSVKTISAFGKAVVATTKCHIDQAEKRFKGTSENGAGTSEENCEDNPGNSAKGKLDARLANLAGAGICDPLQTSGASTEENELFGAGPNSLDVRNGDYFCDSASAALIGDDDAGWVPATAEVFKCEATVAKITAKLSALVRKCHNAMDKALFKGADFDEETCEQTVLAKFNKVRDKLIAAAICPPCLDGTAIDSLAADAIAQRGTTNDRMFPCGLAP
jgi:hypothetical protein